MGNKLEQKHENMKYGPTEANHLMENPLKGPRRISNHGVKFAFPDTSLKTKSTGMHMLTKIAVNSFQNNDISTEALNCHRSKCFDLFKIYTSTILNGNVIKANDKK